MGLPPGSGGTLALITPKLLARELASTATKTSAAWIARAKANTLRRGARQPLARW